MTDRINLGKHGESLAKTYLIDKNYRVLEINWRYRKAEIDLIAIDTNVLVFVEVKTRQTDIWGAPESAVTQQKERLLAGAASKYMELISHQWEIRFDIISIIFNENETRIEHFQDAFFPGLQ